MQKSSLQNDCQVIACVVNPSQTHLNIVSTIRTMCQICDTYMNTMLTNSDTDIVKTISGLNCEKIEPSNIHTTVVRHSHKCLMTVVRVLLIYCIYVVITISSETAMSTLSKSHVYIADLCLQLVTSLSYPCEIPKL